MIHADQKEINEHKSHYNVPKTNEVPVVLVNQECDIINNPCRDCMLHRIAEKQRA